LDKPISLQNGPFHLEMITETQFVQFDSISLDSGATLLPVDIAYETYGELNAAKSNAILILHASSATPKPPAAIRRPAILAGGTT